MPNGRLNLVSRGHQADDTHFSSEYLSSEMLWKKARDEGLHVLFRESAMSELAKRGDVGVADLCRSMLRTEDVDEWFAAIR
ncbi:MAG: hypothetical protein ACXADS_16030, partial [Candidatus Thorarchaeota archaeon]